MAGHSHWANISRKKALIDNKRGKLWSKLSKAIIVAAKIGGGDPSANLKLRYAIDDAKAVSMPKENITRAIKKGTGEIEGGNLESCVYEGYGPHSVAVLCEILTDNRNRTAPEIRKIFEIAGGNMGTTNCVAWMFDTKGLVVVPAGKADEDTLIEIVMDAGGDDVSESDEGFRITCSPETLQGVKEALEAKGIPVERFEITRLANTSVTLDLDAARSVLALMEKLDDHEDVQVAYANFDIPDDVLEQLDG